VYISGIWGAKSPRRIETKFFLEEDIPDLITCFKFGGDRFRGLPSAEGQILPFPIDFDGRPYNTVTLPCERVIFGIVSSKSMRRQKMVSFPPHLSSATTLPWEITKMTNFAASNILFYE